MNLRSLFKNLFKNISNGEEGFDVLRKSPFVRSLKEEGGGLRVELYEEAFPLGFKFKPVNLFTCQNAFE